MDPIRLPAAKRAEYRFFFDAMRQFEWDLRHEVWAGRLIPTRWKVLMEEDRAPRKTRVTIRLDEDVVKFFRSHWGHGYQTKINEVLRAFLKLKLSRFLEGPESLDALVRGVEDDDGRPAFGDWEAFQEELDRRYPARPGLGLGGGGVPR